MCRCITSSANYKDCAKNVIAGVIYMSHEVGVTRVMQVLQIGHKVTPKTFMLSDAGSNVHTYWTLRISVDSAFTIGVPHVRHKFHLGWSLRVLLGERQPCLEIAPFAKERWVLKIIQRVWSYKYTLTGYSERC